MISNKFGTSLTILGLTAFISLSIFGLWHMNEMTADEEGGMAGCIFTGKTMLCKMNIIEHVALWQRMFMITPLENLAPFVLLVLLAAVGFTAQNILAPPHWSKYNALAYKLYLASHPNFSLFDHLKTAFSQGILNPKIY